MQAISVTLYPLVELMNRWFSEGHLVYLASGNLSDLGSDWLLWPHDNSEPMLHTGSLSVRRGELGEALLLRKFIW